MLKEFTRVRQENGSFRRLFTDERFDLYVWYDKLGGELLGFQLVILSEGEEAHAFTWTEIEGSFYSGVLMGGRNDPTPILVANGRMVRQEVRQEFFAHARDLEHSIRDLVVQTIEQHRELVR